MAADFLAVQTQTPWGRNLALFADWIAPQAGWLALDVGCGPGLLVRLLAERGCRALGVDLDPRVFHPSPLYPQVVVGSVAALPFPVGQFDLLTASNVVFLLSEPAAALHQMARLLKPCGQLCLLNPSEHLSLAAATALADERHLEGVARSSLLNWAARAEAHPRWTEAGLKDLLARSGLQLTETSLKIGPGWARLARAVRISSKFSTPDR